MNILIIANPISGKGIAKKKTAKLETILKRLGISVTIYLTKFAGDGKEYASNLNSSSFDRLVVVGGDGTINEIVNGLPDTFSTPILPVSTGNANLLASELKLPKNPSKLVKLLIEGKTIHADCGIINNKTKFLMVAGIGFDALICEQVKKARKTTINNLSYLLPIFKVIKSFKNSKYEIMVDGKDYGTSPAIIISNLKNYAGVFSLAYNAGINTGFLDIIMLPKISFFSLLKYILIIKLYNVSKISGAKYINGSEITIRSNQTIPVELDGDFQKRYSKVDIKIIKGKIPLII